MKSPQLKSTPPRRAVRALLASPNLINNADPQQAVVDYVAAAARELREQHMADVAAGRTAVRSGGRGYTIGMGKYYYVCPVAPDDEAMDL